MRKRFTRSIAMIALISAIPFSAFAASFKPAASIKAPAAVTLRVLPADVAAKKQIRIATIMVQNNPFGMAVMQGTLFAKAILKDRNCKVDWISVPDFDPQKFEAAMQNCITAQYDAITVFGAFGRAAARRRQGRRQRHLSL